MREDRSGLVPHVAAKVLTEICRSHFAAVSLLIRQRKLCTKVLNTLLIDRE